MTDNRSEITYIEIIEIIHSKISVKSSVIYNRSDSCEERDKKSPFESSNFSFWKFWVFFLLTVISSEAKCMGLWMYLTRIYIKHVISHLFFQ